MMIPISNVKIIRKKLQITYLINFVCLFHFKGVNCLLSFALRKVVQIQIPFACIYSTTAIELVNVYDVCSVFNNLIRNTISNLTEKRSFLLQQASLSLALVKVTISRPKNNVERRVSLFACMTRNDFQATPSLNYNVTRRLVTGILYN